MDSARSANAALEPLAIIRRGVEVEAAVLGVQRNLAVDPGRIRIGADAHGAAARARTERGAAEFIRASKRGVAWDRCKGVAGRGGGDD